MSFIEFLTSLGEGYTSVDLGSSSSPPGELANPEILSELDFQKPVNGTPVIQSLALPPQLRTFNPELISVSIQADSDTLAVRSAGPSSLTVTDTTIIDGPEEHRRVPNLETSNAVHIETVRRKPPLMIQRVGRMSLEGFSNNIIAPVLANHALANREALAFDSTEKVEVLPSHTAHNNQPISIVSSSVILIEEAPRDMREEAGVQTIVRLNPSSISICPKIVVDSSATPLRQIIEICETTTPIEFEAEPDAVEVVAEVLPGVEEFILDSTDPVCILDNIGPDQNQDDDSLRLDDPISRDDMVEHLQEPAEYDMTDGAPDGGGPYYDGPDNDIPNQEDDIVEEREYDEPDDVDQEVEFVEAQLLSGTTVTPNEDIQDEPHKPLSAFATFSAITALVKMQRRIKKRYEQQRADLINSLGL